MLQCLALVVSCQALDQFVEVSLQDVVQLVERQSDAMVGYPPLGKIIGSNPAAAITGSHLTFAFFGSFFHIKPDVR